MTQQHPITPPLELVQQWAAASPIQPNDENWAYELFIVDHAAKWSADQELEACLTEVSFLGSRSLADKVRAARRPKPPSLKEQALETLKYLKNFLNKSEVDIVRRALEQLDA